MPKIIIADIHVLVVEGLKALLKDQYDVVSVISSKQELPNALEEIHPDLLILDYYLFDFDGPESLQEIKSQYPALAIIILSNQIHRRDLHNFKHAGIKNILLKTLDKDELFDCISAALKNKSYYSELLLEMMMESNEIRVDEPNKVQLTPSELEIVRLIAEGLTTKEIAQKKFLSFHTIITHRKNIFRKAGVSNVPSLIRFAIRNGLIDNIEYYI